MLTTHTSNSNTWVMGEEWIQAGMAGAAVGITVSWAQGGEKLLTAFIRNLQRKTLPVVGTLYCTLLYFQDCEPSRY